MRYGMGLALIFVIAVALSGCPSKNSPSAPAAPTATFTPTITPTPNPNIYWGLADVLRSDNNGVPGSSEVDLDLEVNGAANSSATVILGGPVFPLL